MRPVLEPQLAELLHTLVHPPWLLLRVVDTQYVELHKTALDTCEISATPQETVKYLLSDDELTVQALLHRECDKLGIEHNASVDDLIKIHAFELKKSRRINGPGQVVYLLVSDCQFILAEDVDFEVEKSGAQGYKRKHSMLGDLKSTGVRASGQPPLMPVSGVVRKRARFAQDPVETPEHEDASDSSDSMLELKSSPSYTNSIKRSAAFSEVHKRHRDVIPSPTKMRSTRRRRTAARPLDEQDDFEAIGSNQITSIQRRQALQPLDQNTINEMRGSEEAASSASANSRLQPKLKAEVKEIDKNQQGLAPRIAEGSPSNIPAHPSMRERPSALLDSLLYQVRDATYALSQPERARQLLQRPASRPSTSHGTVRADITTTSTMNTSSNLLPSPPFHTLRSLRHPAANSTLPSKNYMLTTLAIVSWASPSLIQKANSPFPPKRHIKIVDPSLTASRPSSRAGNDSQTASGLADRSVTVGSQPFQPQNVFQEAITVANYIDASDFQPAVGTIALFRGLVMQRLANGDVILNAYGRLKDQRFKTSVASSGIKDGHSAVKEPEDGENDSFSHWYITDEARIRAFGHERELEFCRKWWAAKSGGEQTQSYLERSE